MRMVSPLGTPSLIAALAAVLLLPQARPAPASAQQAQPTAATPVAAPADSGGAARADSVKKAKAPRPDRWRAALDLAYTASSGNTQLSVLTAGARINHLTTHHFELEANAQVRYGRSAGKEVARTTRAGLKFDHHPLAAWTPFVFFNMEQAPFRKLDLRTHGGAGIKHTLLRSDHSTLSISTATLYSYEALIPPAGQVAPVRHEMRGSWRVKGTRTFSKTSRLENVTFYQPLWHRPADYLMDAQTALTVQLSRALALKVSHSYERDSTPAPGVHEADQVLTVGFLIQM